MTRGCIRVGSGGTRDWMDMEDESEDDERIVLRHDAQNTMLSERLTSDEVRS